MTSKDREDREDRDRLAVDEAWEEAEPDEEAWDARAAHSESDSDSESESESGTEGSSDVVVSGTIDSDNSDPDDDADPDEELRASALGNSRGGDDEDAKKRKRGRGGGGRRKAYALGFLLLSLVVGGLVGLSWLNSRHYYFVCGAESIAAERGSKWPWGTTRFEGEKWRPIDIPPGIECEDSRFESQEELEEAYLSALIAQASAELAPGPPAEIEATEARLTQALLLARGSNRAARRKEIERLFGDVEYWRAAAEIESAIEVLEQAAEKFGAAVGRNPRHQRDSSTWADFAHSTAEELRKGPPVLRENEETPERPRFAGTETSPGGDDGAAAPLGEDAAATAESDAYLPGSSDGDVGPADPGIAIEAPPDAAPPPAPDAGLPTGGVLL